jgi:membrane-associated protein
MFELQPIVKSIGVYGVIALVFAETGLLIGFFLPGDSLLFTAGLLASQGWMNIHVLSHGCFAAAVIGNVTAYVFGQRVGRRLFERPNSRLFKRKHLVSAHKFYEKYGAGALVLARFIPAVRVFAPVVAGVSDMDFRRFMIANVLGGALWAYGMTWGGYALGRSIPNPDRYLLPAVALIVLVSVVPPALHWWRDHRREQAAASVESLPEAARREDP